MQAHVAQRVGRQGCADTVFRRGVAALQPAGDRLFQVRRGLPERLVKLHGKPLGLPRRHDDLIDAP